MKLIIRLRAKSKVPKERKLRTLFLSPFCGHLKAKCHAFKGEVIESYEYVAEGSHLACTLTKVQLKFQGIKIKWSLL